MALAGFQTNIGDSVKWEFVNMVMDGRWDQRMGERKNLSNVHGVHLSTQEPS